jgi:tRNA(Ile)-lysidine synthase
LNPERWHPAVRGWLANERKRGGWGVALSGGADSVALLLALLGAFPDKRGRLVALHFNHRLRGRAADADEKFCARLCASLGVKFAAGRWRGAPKGATEAGARAARLEFFACEMRRRKVRVLWQAHQMDDVAETMLMRLARGSGTAGLAAPRPVQVRDDGRVFLRPLLTFRKKEIVAALREAGIAWREDATNASDVFFRNRVRRSVLPAWVRAAGRDAVAGAALARERLEEDDAALEIWTARVAKLDAKRRLPLAPLAGAPRAVWRRALHRWLLAQAHGSDLSRQGFEQLLAAVERGRATRFSLGRRGFAVARGGWLFFQKSP